MNTKTQLPTQPAEQRLADSYREPGSNDQTPSAPPARPGASPEERMANAYRRAEPREEAPSASPPPRPPLTPDERLAMTYAEPEKPPKTDDVADDAATGEDPKQSNDDASSEGESASLRAPEGFQPLDTETASGLSSIAKELELPDGAMQKLVDKVSPVLAARTNRHLQRVMNDWAEETTNDPEIGGEHLGETVSQARRALTVLGTPELRKLLGPLSKGGTGLGNNKAMVRFLAAVGRKLT